MKAFAAQVRREVWEHQSLVIGPLVLGAATLGCIFWLSSPLTEGPEWRFAIAPAFLALATPYVAAVAAIIYCLVCLSGERRDRSDVFFRSLPVSDTSTVLAKFVAGVTVLPAACLLMCLIATLVVAMLLLAGGIGDDGYGANPLLGIFQILALGGYWAIAGMLWFAPAAAYALLISALAWRASFLFACLPLLLIPMEYFAYEKSYIWTLIADRVTDFAGLMSIAQPNSLVSASAVPPASPGSILNAFQPGVLFGAPALWIGLAVTAGCVGAAILARRHRDDGAD